MFRLLTRAGGGARSRGWIGPVAFSGPGGADERGARRASSDEFRDDLVGEIRQACGGRDGEYPGPEDAVHHAEVQGVEAFCASHTHDAGGDGVRGGDGHTECRRDAQDGGCGGLCSEPVDGLKFHHFMAHGLDDLPSAGGCSGCHDDCASDLDPDGDDIASVGIDPEKGEEGGGGLEGACLGGCSEGEGDDSHGLLRVITAVAPSHVGCAEHLPFSEDGADGARFDL